MGGGDLNQKKSWHPQTMKNQEKVWKAEQAKQEEQRKLDNLRNEIRKDRDREELKRIGETSGVLNRSDNNAKLEWMYKSGNDLINRDEYLLGRKIDKSFETLQVEEQHQKNAVGLKQPLNHVEHECVPFSIREYRNVESMDQVDLQRKTMEDPLMLIKQREMDSRRKLLENPVKLKEIHRLLKTEHTLKTSEKRKNKKTKKSRKSKKSHKKNKKNSNSGTDTDSDTDTDTDNSSDEGKDLDNELAKRYKKLQGDTGADLSLSKLLDAKYKTISKELDKAARGKSGRPPRRSEGRSSSSSDGNESKSKNKTDRRSNRQNQQHKNGMIARYDRQRRSRSQNAENNRRRHYHIELSHQRDRSPIRRSRHSSNRSPVKRSQRSRSRTPVKRSQRSRSRTPVKRSQRSRSRTPVRRAKRSRTRSPFKRSQRSKSHSPVKRSRRNSSRNPEQRSIRQAQSDDRNQQRSEHSGRRHSRSRTPRASHNRSDHNEPKHLPAIVTTCNNGKPRLTDEERAARLREMTANATWREADRTQSVQKHREDYAREEAQNQARDFDKDFINKEVKKAIGSQANIGTRIRSNLNNIQRTSSAMDANFARK